MASEHLICLPIPFGPVLNRTGPKALKSTLLLAKTFGPVLNRTGPKGQI